MIPSLFWLWDGATQARRIELTTHGAFIPGSTNHERITGGTTELAAIAPGSAEFLEQTGGSGDWLQVIPGAD